VGRPKTRTTIHYSSWKKPPQAKNLIDLHHNVKMIWRCEDLNGREDLEYEDMDEHFSCFAPVVLH
jgi:hypothetical protein